MDRISGAPEPEPVEPSGQAMTPEQKAELRRRDFWASLVLIAASLFFLWRTSRLPFFEASAAGVDAEWFNSAALVPFGVFGALLALALGLLSIAVRDGGAPHWKTGSGLARIGVASSSAGKVVAIALILFFYIFALVPRVDFVVASALVLTGLIYAFHEGRARPILLSVGAVAVAGLTSLTLFGPQALWTAHGDDWMALALWLALSAVAIAEGRAWHGRFTPTVAAAPAVSVLVPLLLVAAMAFGFRQNVPARTGPIFGALEHHYYVTLRPWMAAE